MQRIEAEEALERQPVMHRVLQAGVAEVIPIAFRYYTLVQSASVYLIGEPSVNQAGHFLGSGPRSGGGGEMVLEVAQRRIEPVADGRLEQAAEAFNRV